MPFGSDNSTRINEEEEKEFPPETEKSSEINFEPIKKKKNKENVIEIEGKKFLLKSTKRDGHCLFRAISIVMFQT